MFLISSTEDTEIQSPEATKGVDYGNPFRYMNLEVPRFNGENAFEWISMIQSYFDFYNTSDAQCIMIALFHLDGDALDWFEWVNKTNLIPTWSEFLSGVAKRFGLPDYEDSFGKLSKLIQTNSLSEYQHAFERLTNKIMGVTEHVLVSCFVSGLQNELQKKLQVLASSRVPPLPPLLTSQNTNAVLPLTWNKPQFVIQNLSPIEMAAQM